MPMTFWKRITRKIPELEERLLELKREHPGWTTQELCSKLNQEFGDKLSTLSVKGWNGKISPKQVRAKIFCESWQDSEKREKLARLWADPNVTLEEIKKAFPGYKLSTLRGRASRMGLVRGRTRISMNGISKLVDIPKEVTAMKIPETSFEGPLKIKSHLGHAPKIMAINSPFVGILGELDPFKNLVSNALRLAEVEKCDAVVMTGNLVYMDVLRYSNLKPFRARVSGVEPDLDLIDYPLGIIQEEGSPAEKLAKGEVVFIPFKMKFDHVVEMLRRCVTYQGKPIFSGPIYITFGTIEETLSVWLTNESISIKVARELIFTNRKLNQLKRKRKKAKKEELEKLDKMIDDFEHYRRIFVKMTNVAEKQINLTHQEMQKYIIYKLETSIPNSEVIATGKAFIEIGQAESKKKIKIVHRKDASSFDTYLGKLIENTRKAINNGQKQPDLIVAGGTNLTNSSLPVSYNTREGITSVTITQLPTALDAQFIKKVASQGVKLGDAITKLTNSEDFHSGIMIFEWVNGIPKEHQAYSGFLTNSEIFSSKKKLHSLVEGKNKIYTELEADMHHGHRWISYYETDSYPPLKYHNQVIHDFLLGTDAPILAYINLADILQAHNFNTEEQDHPDWLPDYKLNRAIEKLELGIEELNLPLEKRLKEKNKRLKTLLFKNAILGGILMTDKQLESYIANAVVPYHEYFYQILKRAEKVGLVVGGDLGVITLLSGNHFQNTFGGFFSESELIAIRMRDELLKHHPDLKEKDLEKLIFTKMIGKIGIADGVMGIIPVKNKRNMGEKEILTQNEFYFYAIFGKHKQGQRASKYNDSIRSMREAFGKRGTTSSYQEGRFTINAAGHTHYAGVTTSQNSLHIRAGSQSFHDPFGEEHGYPLNNISTEILGLPKDGPHTGLVTLIRLRYEEFQRWAKKKFPVDKEKLFNNAIS